MSRRHALAMVVLGGLVGCNVFQPEEAPPAVAQAFADDGMAGCTGIPQRAERVARVLDDADGAEFELWVTPTEEGGRASVVVISEPGREQFGVSVSCELPAEVDAVISLGGGGMSVPAGGLERVWYIGRAPDGAEQVRADFGDEEITVDVSVDGYFLVARSSPSDGDNMMATRNPSLTALDEDGKPVVLVGS